MAQQLVALSAVDLDADSLSDSELPPFAPPPRPPEAHPQPSTQPGNAIAFTMVAQQTLLPVANTGRRRSRSPSSTIEGRPNPRLRGIQRADPGPTIERGRAWIPAPSAAAATAAAAAAGPTAATAAATVPVLR